MVKNVPVSHAIPRSAARIGGALSSSATVAGTPEATWAEITNVDIANYPHPPYLKVLGIPHPLRAEVISDGIGGERIAYFDTGKRFIQRITSWQPPTTYAFSFNPEKEFRVGYVFDLSDGVVQIGTGSYRLTPVPGGTKVELGTTYSIDRRAAAILNPFVRLLLKIFQMYLLRSISRNVERNDGS